MINTYYDGINKTAVSKQSVSNSTYATKKAVETRNASLQTVINSDTFEYRSAEAEITYSPNSIVKSEVTAIRAASSQSTAATDSQIRNIPTLLAAKMAGISTTPDGSPIINGQGDYSKFQAAQNTIAGNHPKMTVKSSYRYSQQGYSYGNPNPRNSCCTFALATALSVKYNKSITPADIKTGSGGFVMDHWSSDSDPVLEWKYDSDGNGSYDGTAYRIRYSSGEETFKGIDAQLQLGNPVLIHATGRNASGEQSEHWATVIGKENGRYKIIDPWDGTERWLEDMEIYKNGGSIQDYAILSNKY